MAKTAGKRRRANEKKKTGTVRKKGARVLRAQAPAEELCTTELQMNGSRLVVKLSRDKHPQIFDLDRLVKQMQQVMRSYKRKRKMRDVVEFLAETEKSLQIILKNHLEDAMRSYFR